MTESAQTNRLIHETSPYLLQHAHNPVDWYPWGPEALERARAENKPILLSIGYAACHWCHVMERESFDNPDIAARMNRDFVCIKVDREERPDLDAIYMQATLAMNKGHGGWPMTVVLTPDQRPFFAGTYFPPQDRWGRPGFATVLERLAQLWRDEPDAIEKQAGLLTEHLRAHSQPPAVRTFGQQDMEQAVAELRHDFDAEHGGFGSAPKFPPCGALSLLMRQYHRTGDADLWEMVTRTLDGMAQGGMHDHIGGGFARYSVDAQWLVPHFEKMLYDNAQLARAYLDAYVLSGAARYRRVAERTLAFVKAAMTSPEGGFYSSYDADSEGEEGKFYVWTPEQVQAVLDAEDARRVCAYFDITEAGNWEGKSIPHTPRSLQDVAEALGITADALEHTIEQALPKLAAARAERPAPGLDDKIITAWNGLMLGAFAHGYWVTSTPSFLQTAENAADFLLERLRQSDGSLLRTYRAGRAHLGAYLEDYAYLAEGLLDVYEAGGNPRFLQASRKLSEIALEQFADPKDGAFFDTPTNHEALVVRPREGNDGATPNPNAVMAHTLARLAVHFDRPAWHARAGTALEAYGKLVGNMPRAFVRTLVAGDFLLEGPVELVFAGHADAPNRQILRQKAASVFVPNRVVGYADPDVSAGEHALVQGKTPIDGQAALYVCRNFTCEAPITAPEDAAGAIEAGEARAREQRRRLLRRPLSGRATPAATAQHAASSGHAESAYRLLGQTGLRVSALGFGTYRVSDRSETHKEALRQALARGVNLIDTSTNYTDGGSERLCGEVLSDLHSTGKLQREQVVVVSKVGYVQGSNLERARARAEAGTPFPEMVPYSDDCWHCIHPEFLSDQLDRSLERLQLESLDVLLLHNPEYFLAHARWQGESSLEETRATFYERMQRAFAHLEREVAAGRIGHYGVSSNNVAYPAEHPEATCFEDMLAAARRAAASVGSSQCHFQVLQLPLNVLEPRAAQPAGKGVASRAAAEDVGVLVNRPLNAIIDGGLIRLADYAEPDAAPDLETTLQSLDTTEQTLRSNLSLPLQTDSGTMNLADFFHWGRELRALSRHGVALPRWDELEHGAIRPRAQQVFLFLDRQLPQELSQHWKRHRDTYVKQFGQALDALRALAMRQSQAQSAALKGQLTEAMGSAAAGASLSQQAVWLLESLPGVTCVLTGMRRPEYVTDVTATLDWPPLDNALHVIDQLEPPAA